MRIAVLVCMLAACGLLVAAPVGGAVPGMNLTWTSCATTYSTSYFAFACDDNTLAKHLVVSFRLAEDMPDFIGCGLTLTYVVGAGSPMPWWAFGPGGCREGAFGPVEVPEGLSGCTSPYAGGAQGGGAAVDFLGGDRWRLRADWARAASAPLAAGQLYAGIVLRLKTERSFDDGSGEPVCEGCERQACMVVESLEAWPLSNQGLVNMTTADVRSWVVYQGAILSDHGCATPAHPSTWGAVKALYR